MTLESLSLLPKLQEIPTDDAEFESNIESRLTRIREMDRDHFSIEFATTIEAPLTTLFDARNIPDDLREAYTRSFSDSTLDLHEHYLEMVERGERSVTGFISNLKGKVAELRTPSVLEGQFPEYEFSLASDPTQQYWDIRGVDPEGTEEILIQVKTGGTSYVPEVLDRMEDTPNVLFAVSEEIYDKISEVAPELTDQMTDLGFTAYNLTEDVAENLSVLASNHGIDVPDSLGEMLPYIGEVVLGIKFMVDFITTERDFKDVEIQDRSRVHAMKALVLMARFGISTVCVSLGGAAGSIAVPGIGAAAGAVSGGGLAFFLGRRLRPQMLEVAMRIAGVTEDELFYLRNKNIVGCIGESLASTVGA